MSEEQLLGRHRAVMPSWLTLYYEQPLELVSGEGCWVTDALGRRYLDFFGGILTTISGHALEEVVEAIRSQAGRLIHTSTLYLNRPMVELAERISALSGIEAAKVFFVSSGSEANDTALLMACQARRSNQVLALRYSYHGRSFASMATTGIRSWSASGLSPFHVSYVQGGYRLRSPFGHLSDPEFVRACVEDLEQVIDVSTSGDVACFIAEPIQGVAGFVVPPDGMLGEMKRVLDRHGILYISDEVQTGWGRTGEHFWGYEAHGLTPDLITFAKGLGNGLAIGGVVGRAELIDCLGANSLSTFGGNPLACAGALANLEFLLSHDLQQNAAARGKQLIGALEGLPARFGWVGEVRGRGLMVAMEMVEPGSLRADPARAGAVLEAARQRHLLVGRGGAYGNVIRVAPPMTVSAGELDLGAGALVDAVAACD